MSAFFQMNRISPELFSSSWFLTAFAFKLNNLDVVYDLWEEMLRESDPLFLVYISVAFLQHVTHLIIDKEDYLIAQAISQLSFDSMEELHMILPKARYIKRNMPYSIFVQLVNLNIYDLETIDSSIIALEKEFCLTVPPQEVMIRAFPDMKICPCKHKKCAWCVKRNRDLPLIVLDCRQGEEQHFGVFPNTSLVNPELYKDLQGVLQIPDEFIEIRGVFHFCLMGSKEFNNGTFDIKEKASSDSDKTRMVIENLLQAFLVKGFPYVSLVEGGFELCHDFALRYDLPIDYHYQDHCPLCSPELSRLKKILEGLNLFRKTRRSRRSKTRHRSSSVCDYQMYEIEDVDTGLYQGKIYNKASKTVSEERYELAINQKFFTVGVLREYGGDSRTILYHERLETLYRIRTNNKEKRIVGFYFSDGPKVLFFEFQTQTDARTCIGQATKYCNLLN